MGVRAAIWGALFLVAGGFVAAGLVGDSWPTSGRIGAASALFSMGLMFLGIAFLPWILRMTTNPEDYKGGCPVGVRCTCGHFNFKPRPTCKSCGAAVLYP